MIKILVVSHDAGGANILASLVKKYVSDFNWKGYIKGPAVKIFKDKNANYARQGLDINRVLESEKPDLILTGTSWASNIEIDFIRHAKKKGIKTAAFLDHWCNYRERFGYPEEWKKNVPDIVFVGDRWAYAIALRNDFPKNRLRHVENPYFEEIFKERDAILQCKKRLIEKHKGRIKILFLSEPIYRHALKQYKDSYYWGYTEYEIIRDLEYIMRLKTNVEVKIRLHPAEKNNKYSNLLKNRAANITISKDSSLVRDCMWSDIVIGSNSMALVIALIVGRKAVSYIVGSDMTCCLPQKEIHRIESFNELMHEIKIFKKDNRMKNHRSAIVFNKAFLDFFKGINPCH